MFFPFPRPPYNIEQRNSSWSFNLFLLELSLDRESETGTGSSDHDDGEKEGSPKILSPAAAPIQLPTVLLDRKIELLLKEWNQNPDMLFTIHPVDGTFLVWHVKHLDEYNPGIFRQVQVDASSKTSLLCSEKRKGIWKLAVSTWCPLANRCYQLIFLSAG